MFSFGVYRVGDYANLDQTRYGCQHQADRLTLVEQELQAIPYLPVGQVGTVLEIYGDEQPQYLIEFADLEGREYAMAVLQRDEVLALHYELTLAS